RAGIGDGIDLEYRRRGFRIGETVIDHEPFARGNVVEMRLQGFASARGLSYQRRLRRTARVFAAPDGPREAAMEGSEDGPADVRAQEHAAESRVDADLVLVHIIRELLMGPAAGHIAQITDADIRHIDGDRRL